MASSAHVEMEAAKFLQKLIQDSKDEPSKLARKLYVICQHMKLSGKENSLPYQVISRAMETVITQNGIDIDALMSSRLPLPGAPPIQDTGQPQPKDKDVQEKTFSVGGGDASLKCGPSSGWQVASSSRSKDQESKLPSSTENEIVKQDMVFPNRPPLVPTRGDSTKSFEHESPASLGVEDTRSANSVERHDSAKHKDNKKISGKRKKSDSTALDVPQENNPNTTLSLKKGKPMNRGDSEGNVSMKGVENSHTNSAQLAGPGSIFKAKQDNFPVSSGLSSKGLWNQTKLGFPTDNAQGFKVVSHAPSGYTLEDRSSIQQTVDPSLPSSNEVAAHGSEHRTSFHDSRFSDKHNFEFPRRASGPPSNMLHGGNITAHIASGSGKGSSGLSGAFSSYSTSQAGFSAATHVGNSFDNQDIVSRMQPERFGEVYPEKGPGVHLTSSYSGDGGGHSHSVPHAYKMGQGSPSLGAQNRDIVLGKNDLTDHRDHTSFSKARLEIIQKDRGSDSRGGAETSVSRPVADMPFKEHHLKQLRAQCLVFLAFRNGLVPRKLHLEIALADTAPKEDLNNKGLDDHRRDMPSYSQEVTGVFGRQNEMKETVNEIRGAKNAPGSSSAGSPVETDASSKGAEFSTKIKNKKGLTCDRSLTAEERKWVPPVKRKPECDMQMQEALESDSSMNGGRTSSESHLDKDDVDHGPQQVGKARQAVSSLQGSNKEAEHGEITSFQGTEAPINGALKATEAASRKLFPFNQSPIFKENDRASKLYKPEMPMMQSNAVAVTEQTSATHGRDLSMFTMNVSVADGQPAASESINNSYFASGNGVNAQRVSDMQKQFPFGGFKAIGFGSPTISADPEEEKSNSNGPLSSPKYTTLEKWIMDRHQKKVQEEKIWELKQKKAEQRIAACYDKIKENVSSSEDISARTKNVIELKKLQLLQLQQRLRSDFLHDFFKPVTPDMERLKSVKKHRHGRRMKQLERFEQKMKEERLKRIRERQKEFFGELEAHKERLDDHFKWKRERWKGLNKYVKEFHKRKERAHREKIDRIQREKINLLKNNDVEGYLRMVQDAKSDRVKQLLKETEKYLQKLGAKLKDAKSLGRRFEMEMEEGKTVNTVIETDDIDIDDEDDSDQAKHYLESNEKYYLLAHSVKESISEQPTSLQGGKLREYQMNGLRWLVSLYNNHLNGILADEMGLGKTVQVIALICYLMETKNDRGPFLVVVPSSVLPGWDSEISFWAPSVNKITYAGPPEERRRLFKERIVHRKFNVLLTTYEYLMNKHDRPKLSKIHWHYVIIDEGHRIKNASCKLNADLKHYQSSHRLLLTGTPLQNNLEELWALLNFLLPNIFNSSEDFSQWFNKPFEAGGDTSADEALLSEEENLLIINRLHQVLRPFVLRRLKHKVENELPEKIERLIRCEASAYQKLLMNRVEENLGSIGSSKVRSVHNTVMELRNICNHPYLSQLHVEEVDTLIPKHYLPPVVRLCGKLEMLDRLLPKLKATDHRVLFFSTMTRLLDVMEEYLSWKRYKYLRLDGHTSGNDRGALIDEFNRSDSPAFIFLLSIRAGGVGVNLQAADTVIIFDTDWNPQVDLQAQARAHRIGQKRDVLVLRFETVRTVEEQVRAAAEHKLGVANQSITAGFFDNNTSAEDRREYLESLLRECKKEESAQVLDDDALNDIIARSESEIDIFEAVDKQRREEEMAIWQRIIMQEQSKDGSESSMLMPSRLVTDEDLKAFYNAMKIYEASNAGVKRKNEYLGGLDTQQYGRGKRAREVRSYEDQWTEEEFEKLCQADSPEASEAKEAVKGILVMKDSSGSKMKDPADSPVSSKDLASPSKELTIPCHELALPLNEVLQLPSKEPLPPPTEPVPPLKEPLAPVLGEPPAQNETPLPVKRGRGRPKRAKLEPQIPLSGSVLQVPLTAGSQVAAGPTANEVPGCVTPVLDTSAQKKNPSFGNLQPATASVVPVSLSTPTPGATSQAKGQSRKTPNASSDKPSRRRARKQVSDAPVGIPVNLVAGLPKELAISPHTPIAITQDGRMFMGTLTSAGIAFEVNPISGLQKVVDFIPLGPGPSVPQEIQKGVGPSQVKREREVPAAVPLIGATVIQTRSSPTTVQTCASSLAQEKISNVAPPSEKQITQKQAPSVESGSAALGNEPEWSTICNPVPSAPQEMQERPACSEEKRALESASSLAEENSCNVVSPSENQVIEKEPPNAENESPALGNKPAPSMICNPVSSAVQEVQEIPVCSEEKRELESVSSLAQDKSSNMAPSSEKQVKEKQALSVESESTALGNKPAPSTICNPVPSALQEVQERPLCSEEKRNLERASSLAPEKSSNVTLPSVTEKQAPSVESESTVGYKPAPSTICNPVSSALEEVQERPVCSDEKRELDRASSLTPDKSINVAPTSEKQVTEKQAPNVEKESPALGNKPAPSTICNPVSSALQEVQERPVCSEEKRELERASSLTPEKSSNVAPPSEKQVTENQAPSVDSESTALGNKPVLSTICNPVPSAPREVQERTVCSEEKRELKKQCKASKTKSAASGFTSAGQDCAVSMESKKHDGPKVPQSPSSISALAQDLMEKRNLRVNLYENPAQQKPVEKSEGSALVPAHDALKNALGEEASKMGNASAQSALASNMELQGLKGIEAVSYRNTVCLIKEPVLSPQSPSVIQPASQRKPAAEKNKSTVPTTIIQGPQSKSDVSGLGLSTCHTSSEMPKVISAEVISSKGVTEEVQGNSEKQQEGDTSMQAFNNGESPKIHNVNVCQVQIVGGGEILILNDEKPVLSNTEENAPDSTEMNTLSGVVVSVQSTKVELDPHVSKDVSQHHNEITGKGPPLACRDISSAEELQVAGLTKVVPPSETCLSEFKQEDELSAVPLVVDENVDDYVAKDEIMHPEFSASNEDRELSDVPHGVDQNVDGHIAKTDYRNTEPTASDNEKEISNELPLVGQNVEVQIATVEAPNPLLQAVNEEMQSIDVPSMVGSSVEIHATAEDISNLEPSASFPTISFTKNFETTPDKSEPMEKSTLGSTGEVDVFGVLKAPGTNIGEPSLVNEADVCCVTAGNSVDLRQSADDEPTADRLELSKAVHIDLREEDSSQNKVFQQNLELTSTSCPPENSSGLKQSEPEKPLGNSCEEVNVIVPTITEENSVTSVLHGVARSNFMPEHAEGFAEQQISLEKPLAEGLQEVCTIDASLRLVKDSVSGVSEVNAASSLICEQSEEAMVSFCLSLEKSVLSEDHQVVNAVPAVPGYAQELVSEQAVPVNEISDLNWNIVQDSVATKVCLEVNATLPGGSQEEDNEKAVNNSINMEVCLEADATLPDVAQEVDTKKAVPVKDISDLTCSNAIKNSATSEECQEADVTVCCVAQELDADKEALTGFGQNSLEESSLVELPQDVNNAAAPFDAQEGYISFAQAETVGAEPLVHNSDEMPIDLGQVCLEKPLSVEIFPVSNNDTHSISLEEVKCCEQTELVDPGLKLVQDSAKISSDSWEDGPEKPLVTESQNVSREENSCEKVSIHVETNDISAATELSSDSNQTIVDKAAVEVKMEEHFSFSGVTHAADSSFGNTTIISKELNMEQTNVGDMETAEPACPTESVEHDPSHSETGAARFAFAEAQKITSGGVEAAEAAGDEFASGLRSLNSVDIEGQEDCFSANEKMNEIVIAAETGNKNVICSDPLVVASNELHTSELRKKVLTSFELQNDVSADEVVSLGGGSSIHFADQNVGTPVSDVPLKGVNSVKGDAPDPALRYSCALGVESGTSVDYVDVASGPSSTGHCKGPGFADKAVDDIGVVGTGVLDLSVTSSLAAPDPTSLLDAHFTKSDDNATGLEAPVEPLAEGKSNEQDVCPISDDVQGDKDVLSGQDDPVKPSADLGQGEGHLEVNSGNLVPEKMDSLNGSGQDGISASSVNHVTMDTSDNSHSRDKTAVAASVFSEESEEKPTSTSGDKTAVAGSVSAEETEEKTISTAGDIMRLEKDDQCTGMDQSDDRTLPDTALELSSSCQESQLSEQKMEESHVSVVFSDCTIEVNTVKDGEGAHVPDISDEDNSEKINNSLNACNVAEVEDTSVYEAIPVVDKESSISESLLFTSSELQIPVISGGGDAELREGQAQLTPGLSDVRMPSLTDPEKGQNETVDVVKDESSLDATQMEPMDANVAPSSLSSPSREVSVNDSVAKDDDEVKG